MSERINLLNSKYRVQIDTTTFNFKVFENDNEITDTVKSELVFDLINYIVYLRNLIL